MACSQFPDLGLNPHPLHWKHRILTTGNPCGFSSVSLDVDFFFFSPAGPQVLLLDSHSVNGAIVECVWEEVSSGPSCPITATPPEDITF